MTREEVITYGKDYYRDLITACCEISEKHKEFVRMSLEALEQEPCEDCISRKAVMALAKEECETAIIPYKRFVNGVNSLPPVTPKPKTECSCEQIKWERDTAVAQLKELGYGLGEKPKIGHWIYEDVLYSRCSECGELAIIANWSKVLSDFCPNCGAKMESEG